jgi:hypothetical protein
MTPPIDRALPLSLIFVLLGWSAASAAPVLGSKELRIGQTYLPPVAIANGFNRFEPENGSGVSGLGLGAGLGFFVTENIEIGGSASFQVLKLGEGNATSGPGLAPFGRFFWKRDRLGLFLELGLQFQYLSSDNISTTLWSFGPDVGMEIFFTDDWAVRLAPTFRHYIVSTDRTAALGAVTVSNEESGNVLGINWGLAAYF